jgi:hypothetical protein
MASPFNQALNINVAEGDHSSKMPLAKEFHAKVGAPIVLRNQQNRKLLELPDSAIAF